MPMNGLTNGAQPIISFNYGAGEKGRVKSAIRFMTVSCILFTLSLFDIFENKKKLRAHKLLETKPEKGDESR